MIEEPDFILLEGPNGSGKTYLLNLIAALTEPNTGEVIVDGHSVSVMSESEKSWPGEELWDLFLPIQFIYLLHRSREFEIVCSVVRY